MKRWERPLLLFSIALNVSFVSIAATNTLRERRDAGRGAVSPGLFAPENAPIEARAALRHRVRGRLERWHEQHHERLGQRLGLDAGQERTWRANFETVAPQMSAARARVAESRAGYRSALESADPGRIRSAARDVWRAQAVLDSLSAEAIAADATILRPEQRDVFLRAMWRGGPGARGREMFRNRGRGRPANGGDSH